MVSLNNKEELYRQIKDDPQIRVLFQTLFDGELDKPKSKKPTTSEDIVSISLNAIREKNQQNFVKCFDAFSKRRPNEESPWIYDDILIFSLLLGAKKFGAHCAPITSVLKLRQAAKEDEKKKLTDAFTSICEERYNASGPFGFVVLVFAHLVNRLRVTQNQLQDIYYQLSAPAFYGSLSPFSKMLALKAFDLIVVLKDLKDPALTQRKESFVKKFQSRVSIISNIFYWIIFGVLVYFTVVVLHRLFVDPESNQDLLRRIDYLNSVFGFGGFFGFLYIRKYLVNFFNKVIYAIFGFDYKRLLEKS